MEQTTTPPAVDPRIAGLLEVLQLTASGNMLLNAEGRVVYFGGAAGDLLGLDTTEAVNRHVHDVVALDAHSQFQTAFDHALIGVSDPAFVLNTELAGSRVRPVAVQLKPMVENGAVLGVMTTLVDVSARHAANAGLHGDLESSKSSADGSSLVVFHLDARGQCVFMTPTWSTATGQPNDQAMGTGWLLTMTEARRGEFRTMAGTAHKNRHGWGAELEICRANGEYAAAQAGASPIIDAEGRTTGYVGVIHFRELALEPAVRRELPKIVPALEDFMADVPAQEVPKLDDDFMSAPVTAPATQTVTSVATSSAPAIVASEPVVEPVVQPMAESVAFTPEPAAYAPTFTPEPAAYTPTFTPEPAPYTPTFTPEPAAYTPTLTPEPAPYTPTLTPEPAPYTPTFTPEPAPYTPTLTPEPAPVAHEPLVATWTEPALEAVAIDSEATNVRNAVAVQEPTAATVQTEVSLPDIHQFRALANAPVFQAPAPELVAEPAIGEESFAPIAFEPTVPVAPTDPYAVAASVAQEQPLAPAPKFGLRETATSEWTAPALQEGYTDPSRLVDQRPSRAEPEESANETPGVDKTTGLANKLLFAQHVQATTARMQSDALTVSVSFIDLHGLDIQRSAVGTRVANDYLFLLAKRLEATIRSIEIAGRIEGNILAVLSINWLFTEDLPIVARRLMQKLSEPLAGKENSELIVDMNLGMAVASPNEDVNSLFRRAWEALQISKARGSSEFEIVGVPN